MFRIVPLPLDAFFIARFRVEYVASIMPFTFVLFIVRMSLMLRSGNAAGAPSANPAYDYQFDSLSMRGLVQDM